MIISSLICKPAPLSTYSYTPLLLSDLVVAIGCVHKEEHGHGTHIECNT